MYQRPGSRKNPITSPQDFLHYCCGRHNEDVYVTSIWCIYDDRIHEEIKYRNLRILLPTGYVLIDERETHDDF